MKVFFFFFLVFFLVFLAKLKCMECGLKGVDCHTKHSKGKRGLGVVCLFLNMYLLLWKNNSSIFEGETI